MDYNSISVLHKNDSAILALHKEWLPLAVSFLHYDFKRKHEVLLPQDVFQEQLNVYLDHINATLQPEDQYRHDASYYLDRWSREDDLIRIRTREDSYVVQLSPHAERLIGWFEDMQNQGMIGTESRLRNILSLLEELITRSTEDVALQLRQLYDQRDQLDAEIAHIEETQQVDWFSDVQIRERIDYIRGMASSKQETRGKVSKHFMQF